MLFSSPLKFLVNLLSTNALKMKTMLLFCFADKNLMQNKIADEVGKRFVIENNRRFLFNIHA